MTETTPTNGNIYSWQDKEEVREEPRLTTTERIDRLFMAVFPDFGYKEETERQSWWQARMESAIRLADKMGRKMENWGRKGQTEVALDQRAEVVEERAEQLGVKKGWLKDRVAGVWNSFKSGVSEGWQKVRGEKRDSGWGQRIGGFFREIVHRAATFMDKLGRGIQERSATIDRKVQLRNELAEEAGRP